MIKPRHDGRWINLLDRNSLIHPFSRKPRVSYSKLYAQGSHGVFLFGCWLNWTMDRFFTIKKPCPVDGVWGTVGNGQICWTKFLWGKVYLRVCALLAVGWFWWLLDTWETIHCCIHYQYRYLNYQYRYFELSNEISHYPSSIQPPSHQHSPFCRPYLLLHTGNETCVKRPLKTEERN